MTTAKALKRITEKRAEILLAQANLLKYARLDAECGGRNTGLALADKGAKIAELEGQLDILRDIEYALLEDSS